MTAFDVDSYDAELKGPAMLPTTNLRELEHIAIRQALAKCGGEKGPAAKLLGIGEASLRKKLADMDNGTAKTFPGDNCYFCGGPPVYKFAVPPAKEIPFPTHPLTWYICDEHSELARSMGWVLESEFRKLTPRRQATNP